MVHQTSYFSIVCTATGKTIELPAPTGAATTCHQCERECPVVWEAKP